MQMSRQNVTRERLSLTEVIWRLVISRMTAANVPDNSHNVVDKAPLIPKTSMDTMDSVPEPIAVTKDAVLCFSSRAKRTRSRAISSFASWMSSGSVRQKDGHSSSSEWGFDSSSIEALYVGMGEPVGVMPV